MKTKEEASKVKDNVNNPVHYGGKDNLYEAIKRCSSCEAEGALEIFPPDLRTKDGVGSKCRLCSRKVTEAFYAKYPEKEAERRMRNAQHGKRWYQQNRLSQVKKMKWNTLLRKYGITKVEYEKLLSDQDGECAICKTTDPGRRDNHFAVDHNHITGAIRGLLCLRCNCAVGFMKDNPGLLRKAAKYVEAR